LQHLSALLTTDEIAVAMFISVNTVKTHIRSILRKLSVSDATRQSAGAGNSASSEQRHPFSGDARAGPTDLAPGVTVGTARAVAWFRVSSRRLR